MKLHKLKDVVEAFVIYENNEEHIFEHVFASDLMSDALAMINDGEETILITGLANMQSLRTAEMLDITTILFVRNKMPDEDMINLAKDLGMQTLTEGVETQEAYDFLREIGCEKLQGYLFSKPITKSEIEAQIDDGSFILD